MSADAPLKLTASLSTSPLFAGLPSTTGSFSISIRYTLRIRPQPYAAVVLPFWVSLRFLSQRGRERHLTLGSHCHCRHANGVQHFKVYCEKSGMYRLWEPTFRSLNALVDNYRTEAVSQHIPDLRLVQPLSKPSPDRPPSASTPKVCNKQTHTHVHSIQREPGQRWLGPLMYGTYMYMCSYIVTKLFD